MSRTFTAIPSTRTTTTTTVPQQYALKADLGNYVSKLTINDYLSGVAKKSDLQEYQKRGNYVTGDALMPYALKSDVQSKYASIDQLNNYALKSDIPKVDLAPYALKTEIPKVDLSPYAMKTEIPKVDLSPYAMKADIQKYDLSPYALKSEIPKIDSSVYALKSDIPKVDLAPYALKSEMPKVDLSPYALKTEIPKIDLGPYAMKTEIPKVDLAPYALKSDMTQYALKADLQSGQKMNVVEQDKVSLPADYYAKGAGIIQELKTRKALVSQMGNTNAPSTGQFVCAVETIIPGNNEQSGKIIQYAKCGATANYVRESHSRTTWNEWYKLESKVPIMQYDLSDDLPAMVSIAFDKAGKLYGLSDMKALYSKDFKLQNTRWQPESNGAIPLQTIAFTDDNRLMGTSKTGVLMKGTTNVHSPEWVRLDNTVNLMDIKQRNGRLYGVEGNMVYSTTFDNMKAGLAWESEDKEGGVISIEVKDNVLYSVRADNQIYRKTRNSGWVATGAIGIKYITLGPDNEIWAVGIDGKVQRPFVQDYAAFGELMKKTTAFQNDNGGNLSGMLNMNVDCGGKAGLNQMRLTRDSTGKMVQQQYTCLPSNDYGGLKAYNTGNQDWGGGNAIYLDRHNVKCGTSEALMTWKFSSGAPNTVRYDYQCAPMEGLTKCTPMTTAWNEEGGGNMLFLDRHDVTCPGGTLLNRIQLIRDGKGKYRYEYTCCGR